ALDATLRILNTGKTSVGKSRSENLVKFQKQNVLSIDYDFNFDDDILPAYSWDWEVETETANLLLLEGEILTPSVL
ncbi:MAG: hypothetical protein ACK5P3_12940, partial [Dolichospermum sp.]